MIYKKFFEDKDIKYCKNVVIEKYWHKDNVEELYKIYDKIIEKIENLVSNKRKVDISFTLTKYFK